MHALKHLGDAICIIRIHQELSIEELVLQLREKLFWKEVTPELINQIEEGERAVNAKDAAKICMVLDIELAQLFDLAQHLHLREEEKKKDEVIWKMVERFHYLSQSKTR